LLEALPRHRGRPGVRRRSRPGGRCVHYVARRETLPRLLHGVSHPYLQNPATAG
jgi:hypothetical protein